MSNPLQAPRLPHEIVDEIIRNLPQDKVSLRRACTFVTFRLSRLAPCFTVSSFLAAQFYLKSMQYHREMSAMRTYFGGL